MLRLFFTSLFVLLALRDLSIGFDLDEYKRIFEECYRTPFEDLGNLKLETGYIVYNKLVSLISKDYRFFLIVTAYIILWPIYKLYSQQKAFSYIALIIFINMPCFLMIFSGLRQAIATSVGILVYMAIEKKKYVLSILLILLAVSFHVSAVILVLLYPACFLKIKSKHLLFVVPVMILIYLFKTPILLAIIKLAPGNYEKSYGEIQPTGAFGMLVLLLLFMIFSFVIMDEHSMSKRDCVMRNILIIAAIIQLFVPIHGLIQRASYYFLIFVPIAIQCTIQSTSIKKKEIAEIAAITIGTFFAMYFFYNAYFSTSNLLGVFPYKFLWSGYGW